MSAQAETQGTVLDTAKLALAGLIFAGGIGAFYYFGEYSMLLRVLGLLVMAAVAVGVALTTEPGRALWRFGADSRTEVRKVVWPSRQETIQTTLIVVGVVLLMGVFMWLVDMVLLAIMRAVTGQGG